MIQPAQQIPLPASGDDTPPAQPSPSGTDAESMRWTTVRSLGSSAYHNRGAAVGFILVGLIGLVAVAAPILAPHDPLFQDPSVRLMPPAWMEGGSTEYLLGTDANGRDLLSRMLYGLRVSLGIGAAAATLAILLGVVFGLLAGYFGGVVSAALMAVTEIQLAFPFIVLAVAILSLTLPTVWIIILVLSLSGWAIYSRVVRAIVLAEEQADYVLAARMIGANDSRILFKYIFRNIIPPVIILGTMDIATMVGLEALLGFLGLGVQPPTPSWGNIMADGKNYITSAWWLTTLPGLALLLTLFSLNLLGDSLSKFLDPRLR
jgi:ABC-type dipeptide/oligopeptide/nickel transport system permease subunit